jgi:Fusaric acid resistance protein-like
MLHKLEHTARRPRSRSSGLVVRPSLGSTSDLTPPLLDIHKEPITASHALGPTRSHGLTVNRITAWDVCYGINLAIACTISYAITTQILVRFVDEPTTLLGGMWAVVATVFVFRESRAGSLSAGWARLIATCVSFALCLAYLLTFPVTGLGIGVVIGLGTIAMTLLGRRDDIVTTGITTAVVLVVAEINPEQAWQQPILRLADTIIGIVVGVSCKWVGSYAFYRSLGRPVR